MRTTALPSLLALAASRLACAQGFYDACAQPAWSLGYHYNTHMLAVKDCPDADGVLHSSVLSLNDCVSNIEGVLTAQQNGYAFNSCNSCTASTTDATITCQCGITSSYLNPQYVTATFDLNTLIKSNEGIIGCFDYAGIEVAPQEV